MTDDAERIRAEEAERLERAALAEAQREAREQARLAAEQLDRDRAAELAARQREAQERAERER